MKMPDHLCQYTNNVLVFFQLLMITVILYVLKLISCLYLMLYTQTLNI